MFLGIDIGTSSVKAVLTGADGTVMSVASRACAVSHPHPLWSEQEPEDWVAAAIAAVDELADRHPGAVATVAGIGFSGQMHGAVLLGRDGRVLRPAILWNDGRSYRQCAALEAALPDFRAISGNIAMPGFTAPKLLWVAEEEPELFAETAKVLLPKAYVRWRLTGTMVEEMSDASGTLWLDVARRDWSDALLGAGRLSRAHMPELAEGSAPVARLSAEFTRRWGMGTPPVVAGGAGDCAASAVGLGAIAPGDGFLSLGTSGVVWQTTDRFLPNPAMAVHAFCHALPGVWHQMGVMLSSAASLAWAASTLGTPEAELLAPLGDAVDGPAPVAFLPYLSGERTPHNNATVRGLFAGLSAETGRNTLVQAVLEGVAFAARDNLLALGEGGVVPSSLDLAGGGSRSRLWARICADALGLTIHRIEDGEVGAALGAAHLGRMAATGEEPSAVCRKPRRLESFTPDPARAEAYTRAWLRWRRLYPLAKEFAS
ncbi:xylulokinase [Azospirillum picis]|uniref:Xylulose kinase n=1 Tax=Azospirillum picis TaxID=488438 RepID=A0ABU0MQA3_9PROT|nr:xylulokinase [Azospirillum picis]MBP2302054.1 xylulokinase [Azospirillum picis]MDQ0535655.1 xylulokinase [Azospirillum picis]